MSLPQQPSEPGPFEPQHGYNLKVQTQKYSDKPTPLKPTTNMASDFIASKTDKEHQKKYAKEGGKRAFNFLWGILCQ